MMDYEKSAWPPVPSYFKFSPEDMLIPIIRISIAEWRRREFGRGLAMLHASNWGRR